MNLPRRLLYPSSDTRTNELTIRESGFCSADDRLIAVSALAGASDLARNYLRLEKRMHENVWESVA